MKEGDLNQVFHEVKVYLDSKPRPIRDDEEITLVPNGSALGQDQKVQCQMETWLFAGEDRKFAKDMIKDLCKEKGLFNQPLLD